jgi:hypothetical protein
MDFNKGSPVKILPLSRRGKIQSWALISDSFPLTLAQGKSGRLEIRQAD